MDYLKPKPPSLKGQAKGEEKAEAKEGESETPNQAMAKTPSTASAMKAGGGAIVGALKTAEKVLAETTTESPLVPTRLAVKSQEERDLMDTEEEGEGTDSQVSRFSGKDDESSKYEEEIPQAEDTPVPNTKKAGSRRLRRVGKTPDNWENNENEEYYSAEEDRHTTEKKKKKRGPTSRVESDSARPRRGGSKSPRKYSAEASTPSRGTRSQKVIGKKTPKEKGSKKI